MDVAITGSSGLIGSALRDALTADGHRVVALVRSGSPGTDELGWDPPRGTIDGAGLEGIDAVVHLAGQPIGAKRWNSEQKRAIVDSRVHGTDLIARTLAGLRQPPTVLVSSSAVGFYGTTGVATVDERAPAGSGFLAHVATVWEQAADPAREAGIRVAHPRTGIVLSNQGGALGKMLPLFKLGLGGPFGDGNAYWSWISLTDEVRALRWLIDHDIEGAVNLTGPVPVTNNRFVKALGEVLHRPTVFRVPFMGPKLLLGAEMAMELLFTSIRAVPAALTDAGFEFVHGDVVSALEAEIGS